MSSFDDNNNHNEHGMRDRTNIQGNISQTKDMKMKKEIRHENGIEWNQKNHTKHIIIIRK